MLLVRICKRMHIRISLHSCWRPSAFSSLSTPHFFILFWYLIYIFEIISKLTSWYHSPRTNYRICIFIFKHFLSFYMSLFFLFYAFITSLCVMWIVIIIIMMFEKITGPYILQNHQFEVNTFTTSSSWPLSHTLIH